MNRIKNLNKLFFSLLFFSLFFGILFRSYNLNYDNLWFDEIVSFWVSDPTISFKESFERHQIAEATPFFWNLLLKIFHKLFVYEPSVGRYLSCLIGILSCFSLAYLSRILKKDNSYILTFFLICFNVFLIKYSQELRVYSLIFFLSTINLIFFFRLIESHKTKINILFNLSFFLIFQTLIILTHPFCLIIFFSIILFSCISFLIFKKNYKYLNISIIIITIFNLIYIPIYVKNLNFYSSWITQPELSFYTNFYFSKFFGSRLVGLIHLIILLSLIIKFRKKFLSEIQNLQAIIADLQDQIDLLTE